MARKQQGVGWRPARNRLLANLRTSLGIYYGGLAAAGEVVSVAGPNSPPEARHFLPAAAGGWAVLG
ncbi:MAG: hypothetical protein ACRD13_04345 [Terriglobales bacterium]